MRLRFLFTFFMILTIIQGCEQDSHQKRKIKLSDDFSRQITRQHDRTTVLKLDAQEKRSIAILTFENRTGNQNLDWLSQGITDMLIRDLSQSRHLNVITLQRLLDIINKLKVKSLKSLDYRLLSQIGGEAQVDAIIQGRFSKAKDSLLIDVQLFDVYSGDVLQENRVVGYGLEKVFGMVDDLSKKIKTDLRISLEEADDLNIADITTNSLDAYQHYARGFDLVYKAYFGDAIKEFEQAIQYDSTFVMANLWASVVYRSLGQGNEAKQAITRALKYADRSSTKERMKIKWINSLYNDRYEEAYQILKQLVQEFPDDKELHYQLAANYYYRQEIDKSQQELRKVFELDANYVMAYMLQSILYQQNAKLDSAIMSLKSAIAISPTDAIPYNNLGEIYQSKGDHKKAEKYYLKALSVKPNFYYSSLGLAHLYSTSGRYDDAVEKYLATLDLLPSEELKASVYAGLAFVDRAQGKYNDAIEHLKQALKFQTTEEGKANYNMMLAGIYLRKGMYDSTITIVRKSLSLDSRNFYIYNVIVDAFLKMGQIDSSKKYAEALDDLIEKSKFEILRSLHFEMMAKISAAEGKYDDAIANYEKIRTANPESESVYEDLGEIYLESNQPLKAIANYQKYLQKNPHQALAKYHLAVAYNMAGDKKNAQKTLNEFLNIWEHADPDVPELVKAKDSLKAWRARRN